MEHDTKIRLGAERHPEKQKNPDSYSAKKPDWLRVRVSNNPEFFATQKIVRDKKLVTVLRRSRLPKYRRMLGKETRNFHDFWAVSARAPAPFAMWRRASHLRLILLKLIGWRIQLPKWGLNMW